MGVPTRARGAYLAVCLNPVIQKTLVYDRLVPGEVNRTAEHRVDVAGKGVCCSRVLGQLGREALHLTQLGGPTRDWFISMCADDGVELRWVESGSEIRFCTTVIEKDEGRATELVEEARPVSSGTADRLLAEFSSLLPLVRTVMISGTKATGLPPSVIPRMAALAAAAGKRLFLDLKGDDLLACLGSRPLVAKPNLEELLQTFAPAGSRSPGGMEDGAAEDFVSRIGRDFLEKHGTHLVVTRGSRPTLFWDGDRLRSAPVEPVRVVNPIGSGDAFNVGLAVALEKGASLAEAVAEGNRLGGLNATRLKPGSIE